MSQLLGTLCVGPSWSCLPQTGFWSLFWAPGAPLLSQLISALVKGLPQMCDPLLTFSLHLRHRSCSASSPFPSAFFHPTWLCRDLSSPFSVHGPLLVFSRCSVTIFPFVDVYSWCIFGQRWTACLPTPLPSLKVWMSYFNNFPSDADATDCEMTFW